MSKGKLGGPSVRIIGDPAGGGTGKIGNPPRFWGLTARQRLERSLARAGAPTGSSWAERSAAHGLALLRDDYVFDEMLVPALLRQPGVILLASDSAPAALHAPGRIDGERVAALESALMSGSWAEEGLRRVTPAELASTFNQGLRKRAAPYLLRVDAAPAVEIERRMFAAAYKGVTDFVTKRVWPRPAFHATRFCARHGLSPNLVTAISLVFVVIAMGLFWCGWFVPGLVAAWTMCFLDTVDGKLARVTLRSSSFGNIFDHGIDLIHPPFWYWAWYHGVTRGTVGDVDTTAFLALLLILIGYLGGRLQEGLFVWLFGIQIHIWRPLDSWFREVTARRNPNLFILTLGMLVGDPRSGFLAVAAWTAVSFVFHTVRIAQAMLAMAHGRAPISWLSEPVARAS
ncbi:MAG TPA: CDP-alcohol phosphatidyltransferase family protein [Candidatus Cybelea sp.]|nr:CDP-alcohol phosphatidyltransferase family protein [Candidatus Cybelea sp.]